MAIIEFQAKKIYKIKRFNWPTNVTKKSRKKPRKGSGKKSREIRKKKQLGDFGGKILNVLTMTVAAPTSLLMVHMEIVTNAIMSWLLWKT